MSGLIFYNSYDIFCNKKNIEKLKQIPGGLAFSSFFYVFSQNITAIDRTGIIKGPMKTELLPHLRLPQYDSSFSKTYEEIVDERAIEVLNLAKVSNRKLAVMYSGGIDSTLILCSFLRNFTDEDIKNWVVVLLSDHSVKENENFFYNYVVKKFNCASSFRYPYFLGNNDYIMLTGENADQLFGSQANDSFASLYTYDALHDSIKDREGDVIDFFTKRVSKGRKKYAEPLYRVLKKMNDAAPIELNTVYNFFWWINFSIKWQSVYARILPFSQYPETLKLQDNYTTFFYTDDFQQWAMNNTDKFFGPEPGPGSVKIPSKKYIIDVNGDTEYINKPKVGSLTKLVKQKQLATTVDSNMNFRYDWPTEDMFNYDNDFVEMMK